MRTTSIEKIAELQQNPACIRNICILAHVDHGKTTLADTLVASNGIISQRMAGKLRYLDSREDEQVRGITMKSSAISLHYASGSQEYLVNLIDSPGHIDFASEVSTAVRLCDGAVVLVDVVEGVCPQTHAVLRQAWLENIKPVLVLNKIDRLILEWKLSPLEAYIHLMQVLEQVNAITGELFTSGFLEKNANETTQKDPKTDDKTETENQVYDWSTGIEETDDEHLYFSPDQGNVIFASAFDGWGFGVDHFAELLAKKLGFSESALKKTLWGDFYLESKTKRVKKGAQMKGKKPLFVQFVLENLWSVYETVYVRRDKTKMDKIVDFLGLKINPRDARHNDPRVQLQAVCSQWLPLSKAVLGMVVKQLPSPLDVTEEHVEKLLCSSTRKFDSLPQETQQLKQDFQSCSPEEHAPVIVYVSKMFPVDRKALPNNRQRPLTAVEIAERRELAKQRHAEKLSAQAASDDTDTKPVNGEAYTAPEAEAENGCVTGDTDGQVFIAFARVFSGTVRKGQTLYVLGPKHDPTLALRMTSEEIQNSKHITAVNINDLYLFMGRELESMDSIPTGNILGLGGLEQHILKSATLASTIACPSFSEMHIEAAPIVRVAVTPKQPGDMQKLANGLRLLNQADSCVEIVIQETGEHVISAAGEVHLQKCIDDLIQRFAKVEINVSKSSVPFRETIVPPPVLDMVDEEITDLNQPIKPFKFDPDEPEILGPGLVEMKTANQKCTVRIQAKPLPSEVSRLLEENRELMKTLDKLGMGGVKDKTTQNVGVSEVSQDVKESILNFKEKLTSILEKEGKYWRNAVDNIWSFGPRRIGPNILLNRVEGYERPSVWEAVCGSSADKKMDCIREYDNSIISGFQLATLQGPLCEEPMMGVCFTIESWDYVNRNGPQNHKTISQAETKRENYPDNIEQNDSNYTTEDCFDNGQRNTDPVREENEQREPPADLAKLEPDGKENGKQITQKKEVYGPFTGQLMSCVKDGCRKAFQSQPQRLMVAMYTCVIQATSDVLGKLYAVLGKRNGRVLHEDMKEGSSIFNITALIPVVESFGFAEEMRKKTSGLASPQLKFTHWEVVDLDPFWEPTTDEEYMHYGEKADSENTACKYMNQVRKRKGLKVHEQIVEFAEKQRTLGRNK